MGQSRETEKALIGILIQKPDFLGALSFLVSEQDFSGEIERRVYRAIFDGWKSGEHIDLVVLGGMFPDLAPYLAEAVDVIPLSGSAQRYALEIRSNAMDRRIATALKQILAGHGGDPRRTLDHLADLLAQESTTEKKKAEIKSVVNRFEEHVGENQRAGQVGFPTGYSFADEMDIVFQPGHIWTVAGFTSVGKTAVMVDMVCRSLFADRTRNIVIFSTEMTEVQLVARMVANITGVPTHVILSGSATANHRHEISKALAFLRGSGLVIHDEIYSLPDIEASTRAASLKTGVDLVVVDYVQNCQVPDAKNLYQEQSALAKRFQKMAKDNLANVIALSQLSNSAARGESSNLELKGAGEWAAVSDVSVRLSRPKGDKTGIVFQFAKNRHGKKHGDDEGARLEFIDNFTRLRYTDNLVAR